jgi:hypothetical protein
VNEQDRAEQFAADLDRLLAGEYVGAPADVLQTAQVIANLPVEPSPQAVARFEQKLDSWFGKPTSQPIRPRRIPLQIGLGVLIAIVLVIVVYILLRERTSELPAVTPTVTPSFTQTPTETLTETLTETPISYSTIVIDGSLDSVQGDSIVVLGQAIHVTGNLTGLCTGDSVHLKVSIAPDGTYHVERANIQVQVSACKPTPAPPPPHPDGNPDKDKDRDKDKD